VGVLPRLLLWGQGLKRETEQKAPGRGFCWPRESRSRRCRSGGEPEERQALMAVHALLVVAKLRRSRAKVANLLQQGTRVGRKVFNEKKSAGF
jgi:hypothetical protein